MLSHVYQQPNVSCLTPQLALAIPHRLIHALQATRTIDFHALAVILVDKSSSQDEFTRLTAIKWLKEFVAIAPQQLVPQYAEIIGAVLPNISHSSKDIQQVGPGCTACTCVDMCYPAGHSPWSWPGLAYARNSCSPCTVLARNVVSGYP